MFVEIGFVVQIMWQDIYVVIFNCGVIKGNLDCQISGVVIVYIGVVLMLGEICIGFGIFDYELFVEKLFGEIEIGVGDVSDFGIEQEGFQIWEFFMLVCQKLVVLFEFDFVMVVVFVVVNWFCQ